MTIVLSLGLLHAGGYAKLVTGQRRFESVQSQGGNHLYPVIETCHNRICQVLHSSSTFHFRDVNNILLPCTTWQAYRPQCKCRICGSIVPICPWWESCITYPFPSEPVVLPKCCRYDTAATSRISMHTSKP